MRKKGGSSRPSIYSVADEATSQQIRGRYSSLPTEIEYSKAGCYNLWAHTLYAPTIELFQAAWDMMKEIFASQIIFLQYLEGTYLPICHQWATCHTNQLPNFGSWTTSLVEGVNRTLKGFIVTGNSTIYQAVDKFFQMAAQMERKYNDNKKHDKERMQGDYLLYEWLGEARTKACWRAQDLVVRQYRHMLRYLPDSPRE